MQIPFVDLNAQYLPIDAEVREAVGDVLSSRVFIHGDVVKAFEQEAAAYLGVKHAIGVANGSDALLIALLALGVGPGDEVITVPHTYIATPEAIYRTGAKLVFCDVEPTGWNMDPEQLKKLITPKTKCILPVHIFGQCAEIEKIRAVAGNIPILGDAAQAWGSSRNGKKCGALCDIETFSFYPTKTLGAAGDGGMVVTSNDELAAIVRALRVHGESRRYYNQYHGMNSRLDAIQAAILRIKLRKVDAWNTERAKIADYYRSRFEGTGFALGKVIPGNVHVWHQCVGMTENRDALQKHLTDKGVGCGVYYPVPQHLQICYQDLGYKKGDYPVAESISDKSLALPCWPEMTQDMRQYVADSVVEFYK